VNPPRRARKLVELATEARGPTAGWRTWTDVTILKVIELGIGVGTEKAIGDRLRGLTGEETRSASVEAPAVETHPSPESTLPGNPPTTSCCSPTSSFSSFSARSLSSSLA
jgi:hypothetical protein